MIAKIGRTPEETKKEAIPKASSVAFQLPKRTYTALPDPYVKLLDAATLTNILISAGVQAYFAVLVIGEELTR
jgi:hypothetical protein